MAYTLFRNANIYSPVDTGKPASGKDQGRVVHYPTGALLVNQGLLVAVGDVHEVEKAIPASLTAEVFEMNGQCLIPGFVDPHTHMCFAARREAEFEQRIAGTPYLEILKKGGGILSSVKAVAAASEDDLYNITLLHAQSALKFGTTTLEIKSGYGLDLENELKMLRAIQRVKVEGIQDVVATFLGAHAIPVEYVCRSDDFIDLIISEMLPVIVRERLADQCDIFCEEGVFTIEQGRKLLTAAKDLGMQVKLHADEVHDLGGAGLAAEMRACSADHLLAASDKNIRAMASAGVVANLLPATAYSLRKPYARARFMIENGLPVALATDCNPGSSYTESMPFIVGLAVLNMQLTPAEALVGATLNAAYGINMASSVGSLDVGKQADFLVLNGESPAILAYHAGVSPVVQVYKRGQQVA